MSILKQLKSYSKEKRLTDFASADLSTPDSSKAC